MPADLLEKTDRYCSMFEAALEAAEVVAPRGTPLGDAAIECREMAEAYLTDAEHFRNTNDLVNALAAVSYGYGWLDCGARLGLFAVPESHLFAV